MIKSCTNDGANRCLNELTEIVNLFLDLASKLKFAGGSSQQILQLFLVFVGYFRLDRLLFLFLTTGPSPEEAEETANGLEESSLRRWCRV